MPLTLLDGKVDLLRQVLAWLELRDRKALSSVSRYTVRSELRQLVFSQSVLRLPALQSVVPEVVAADLAHASTKDNGNGSTSSTHSTHSTDRVNATKKRSGARALESPTMTEDEVWRAYYAKSFLRQLDPNMVPFIQRVLVPLSMAKRLLGMLQFAPNLQRVSFWNDVVPATTKSKVKQITVMDMGYVSVLPALQSLDLSAIKHVHCFDAIDAMASLRTLDLSGTNVSDTDAFGALRSIEVLNLRRTRVADLSFLASIGAALHWLDISDSRVQDFASLKHARALEYLNMSRNWVRDVSSLRFLGELRTLKLCNSGSLGPLDLVLDAPHLLACHVHDTMLSDLRFLLATPQLELLDIRRTHIVQDFGPLAALVRLETLLIDDSIVAYDPLVDADETDLRRQVTAQWARSLQRLKHLQIDQSNADLHEDELLVFANPIDGSLLAHLPALETLETPALVDYAPLHSAFSSLRALELHSWTSEDLRRLALDPRAATLKVLKLTLPSSPEVVDLLPLESFEALESLELVDALFEDLAPIGALVHLQSLNLSLASRAKRQLARKFRREQDFSFVSALLQLQVLRFDGRVDLRDVSPLRDLRALRRLNLQGTKVATLAPLVGLQQLTALNVASTPLERASEITCLQSLASLEELWIPEKVDCTELQHQAPRLRSLWHREDFNCLWTNHRVHV